MPLNDAQLDRLIDLIQDSFRIRENHNPPYVDVAGHLSRVASPQHQVIFGRRGSGKSCLLIHFHRKVPTDSTALSIYVNADEVKQLGYPDLLIRILLTIFSKLPGAKRPLLRRMLRWPRSEIERQSDDLRALLDRPEKARVTESTEDRASSQASAGVRQGIAGLEVQAGRMTAQTRTSEFVHEKVQTLERHLPDYKTLISKTLKRTKGGHAAIIVDDFYLIRASDQPDVVDYLHRLTRGTDFYLKIGTIKHRTRLMRRDEQPVGVELEQDVESIDLDRTLQDMSATQSYLAGILNELGRRVSVDNVVDNYMNPEAPFALALASGGVPRDYLSIFVDAVRRARERDELRWITPTQVYRAAASRSYQTKLSNLREDVGSETPELESLFQDLYSFCIKEKRKTAFLIAQDEVAQYEHEHELIQQLMDFKLIHVVEPDTSAASGRSGRYEAYTLDAATFMEPRRRNIEIVEFWKIDDQRRRMGLRESPVYSLARAREAIGSAPELQTEEMIAEVDAESIDTSEDSNDR